MELFDETFIRHRSAPFHTLVVFFSTQGNPSAREAQFLSGEEPLRYAIFFENVETATAPAQEVVITDQLDLANIDLSTFSLGPIAFGDKTVVPPPGLSEFTTDMDLLVSSTATGVK